MQVIVFTSCKKLCIPNNQLEENASEEYTSEIYDNAAEEDKPKK